MPKSPRSFVLTDTEIEQLRVAVRGKTTPPYIRDSAIILLYAVDSPGIETIAKSLGIGAYKVTATLDLFLKEGIGGIMNMENPDSRNRDEVALREKILALLQSPPKRRIRWTPLEAGPLLGLSPDEVRYWCQKLGIDLQKQCDDNMREKIIGILQTEPKGSRWTFREIAPHLNCTETNAHYWFKKLGLVLPPEKRDRKKEVLDAIAALKKPYWNYSDLGRQLGISARSALDVCKKHGITLPPNPQDRLIRAALAKMPALWNYSMLARESGYSHPTITTWCKKNGVSP